MVKGNLCLLCRGAKHLCGRPYCPIIAQVRASLTLSKAWGLSVKGELQGSSPPSVFIGRYGYPKVAAGPSAPPISGDTSIYEVPERWLEVSLDELISMRLSLISGYGVINVKDAWSNYALKLQELALSVKPIDIEVVFSRAPRLKPVLSSEAPPMGPRAPARLLKVVGNPTMPKPLSRAYYDTDLPASQAVIELYGKGVEVSRIQRALSVGALGVGRRRRLVPTRWAITAVDDMVSKHLVKKIKHCQELGEYQLFIRRYMSNLFIAILIPSQWSFEWMEAWFPGSTWNPDGLEVSLEGDWEGPGGRSEYASIGGCYYAARLATAEYLVRVRRKAAAVLYREIYPGFNIPIGVWFVRENLRRLFKGRPERFSSLRELLKRLEGVTRVNLKVWVRRSAILSRMLRSSSLDRYSLSRG